MRKALGLFFAISLCAALLGSGVGCSRTEASDRVSLSFVKPDGGTSPSFSMEVVADFPSRQRGLMFRKSLGANEGMVFVFPNDEDHRFWMKNTYIPLDMVFVSKEMRVVGVLSNVPPLTDDPCSVGVPSRYVLEFAAGAMKENGIDTGARVTIEGELPVAR